MGYNWKGIQSEQNNNIGESPQEKTYRCRPTAPEALKNEADGRFEINVSLIRLPPYSPELNPAEQIWNILRRSYFANRVFDALDDATTQTESGLAEMVVNKLATRQLTNWPWISTILKT